MNFNIRDRNERERINCSFFLFVRAKKNVYISFIWSYSNEWIHDILNKSFYNNTVRSAFSN